jgi:hypothetical protein
MNTKGLINSAKTRAGEAEKLAARKAGPAPIPTEPEDPDAELKGMINRHNVAALEAYNLEDQIMQALLLRRNPRVLMGEGGQNIVQLYHADWNNQRRPRVLIVESLGTPI